jgi:transaldolase
LSERLPDLGLQLFLDGADLDEMRAAYAERTVQGFTTNPTLMRKHGVRDYRSFAREALEAIPDLPISFEVLSDDLEAMEREAREIASWGANCYVKVPITTTGGQSTARLLERLSSDAIPLNVTAILTLAQVQTAASALDPSTRAIVSVFAGRVADTGIDPVPLMSEAASMLAPTPKLQLLWASPRELLNVVQAAQVGCHIITVLGDVLRKLPLLGRDLGQFSLETVRMFHSDALAAGYKID